jgi:hypothetical protein
MARGGKKNLFAISVSIKPYTQPYTQPYTMRPGLKNVYRLQHSLCSASRGIAEKMSFYPKTSPLAYLV